MREYSPQNGIIFWRIGPLQYRLPLLGECSRNPSVSVHQLALLWEAAFAFSDFFFEDSFSVFAHFMMGDLWLHLPTPHWVFSSFWPKMVWPPCPTLSIYLISPRVACFVLFSQKKKVLTRKHFADVEEVKQKTAEALKGINISEFKKCFEQWKRHLDRYSVSHGECFEGYWSLNM